MVKMADDRYTFAQARARLEDIVVQVRKKDTSLEKSLDLLEEGVRLANACTELSDHTEWRSVAAEQDADTSDASAAEDEPSSPQSTESVDVDRTTAEQDMTETEAPASDEEDSGQNRDSVATAQDDESDQAEVQVDDEADSDR